MDAIEDLLIKERLDLAPQLRELDTQIEDVELRLRKVVRDGLDGDVSRVPSTCARRSPRGSTLPCVRARRSTAIIRDLD